MYKKYFKRVLDVILSFLGLLVLSPLFVCLGIVIKFTDPGPVFFRQKRVGKGKRYFFILKFRTMKTSTPQDCPTHLLENPEYWITPVGRFLRRSSLDELPQIWNIFVGDMSVVGPRPALWNQYDLLQCRDQCGANEVRPGLTGWAQINGRDEISIEKKAQLDGEYIYQMSFLFDLIIFFKTMSSVFNSTGVREGK